MTDNGENDGLSQEIIPQYPYNGRDNFLAILDHEFTPPFAKNEFLLCTNISDGQFQRDFLHSDENDENDKRILRSVKEYSSSSQSLLVKMHSAPHEQAISALVQLITEKAVRQGISDELNFPRSESRRLHPGQNTIIKEADDSIVPMAFRDRGSPTITIEVARSESDVQLQRDAENWLVGSHGQVLSVITILVRQESHDLVLRRWTMQSGAPAVAQEVLVNVHRSRLRNQDRFNVSGGPFTIPFFHLFLRQPNPNSNEADFQFTAVDLDRLARRTWNL
ncbi:uncharacterized protein N7477_002586 [Penicillium maclennaniae]|uniref:uncharacterized protein n=1 Tax=Penicillium maclennaniae TaxID=1343394 RepID=UPI0025413545|nr:uncharacterized protein N7477_002586 [Penicillium maclennaniae]KAJ5676953.1 hypothetical protein N7477_002586 [Penicillium maclennaniae]